MSLLGNLVTQAVSQAMDSQDTKRNPVNKGVESSSTGGLGDILGSVLGDNSNKQANSSTQDNGFGLDDIVGGMLGGQSGGATGGLGSILGSVLGGGNTAAGSGSSKSILVAALIPIALNWIQSNGGLSGALNKVQQMGFGSEVQSWMSTEQQNQKLDPNQITQLFDQKEINQVSQQTGADETEVRQGLAELLPEVVNQLTPNGGLDQEQQANSEINEILSQISNSLPK